MTPIRSALLALLQAIPGIGLVHDHERYAKDTAKFRELYQASPDSPILGWHIRRVATAQDMTDVDDVSQREDRHTWEIRGYMSLDDAAGSEPAFDALIEAIRDGRALIITAHDVLSTAEGGAGATAYLDTDFEELVSYVAGKRGVGMCDVMTIDAWASALSSDQ